MIFSSKPIKAIVLFLIFSGIFFGVNFILNQNFQQNISLKIHFLLFFLSFIVILTTAFLYKNHRDKIGFAYLGFVVFKMFGIGYLAVFEKEFKQNLLIYFGIFWLYLMIEAFLVVSLLPKQDINHKNLEK